MRLRILLFLSLFFFATHSGWSQETAENWFESGNEATQAGNYQEAIRCFERSIALDPNHLGSYRNIGCVYGIMGMWDEAISPFVTALRMNPDDAQIHHNLGFCWYKKGMFDKAIMEFKKAIDLKPEFRDAYYNLGIVYGKKDMFDQAIPMFKEALKIGPDNPDTYFSLGKAYNEVGKDVLAADHYYKAGTLYLREGHREGALTAYEHVLPISPEIAGDLARRLYPEGEVPDLRKPVPYAKEEEVSAVTRPLPPVRKEEVSALTARLPSEEKPVEKKEHVSDLKTPLPSEKEEEVSEVTKPLPPENEKPWHVVLTRMNLREGPSIGNRVVGKLNTNDRFQIVNEAPDNDELYSWYMISAESGLSGWLCGIYKGKTKYQTAPEAGPLPSEVEKPWYFVVRPMNVRKAPSLDSKVLATLNTNDTFQIIDEAPNNTELYAWYIIRTESGLKGWLYGIYDGRVKYKKLP